MQWVEAPQPPGWHLRPLSFSFTRPQLRALHACHARHAVSETYKNYDFFLHAEPRVHPQPNKTTPHHHPPPPKQTRARTNCTRTAMPPLPPFLQVDNHGCYGGDQGRAFDWVLRHGGLARNEEYPYRGINDFCKRNVSEVKFTGEPNSVSKGCITPCSLMSGASWTGQTDLLLLQHGSMQWNPGLAQCTRLMPTALATRCLPSIPTLPFPPLRWRDGGGGGARTHQCFYLFTRLFVCLRSTPVRWRDGGGRGARTYECIYLFICLFAPPLRWRDGAGGGGRAGSDGHASAQGAHDGVW